MLKAIWLFKNSSFVHGFRLIELSRKVDSFFLVRTSLIESALTGSLRDSDDQRERKKEKKDFLFFFVFKTTVV